MFGCRYICVSLASTACVALSSRRGTHAFVITTSTAINSFGIHDRFAKRILRSTSCASSFDSEMDKGSAGNGIASPFPQLHDKTLVSVQHCLDAFNQEQRSQPNQSPKIVFIDGSWYHRPDPTTGRHRNPSQEYTMGPRLHNARNLDIDALATTRELFPDQNPKGLPHMMPPPKLFGLAMDASNIRNEDHLIIYARRGALFTPRAWFLFISMGHDPKKVHLMQGSLEDYMEEGGLVDTNSLLTKEDEGKQQNGENQYCATMGEGYIDCFEQGILNVTRLYHTHYVTTTPQYSLNVSSATNICGKEEVLDAVNSHLESVNVEPKSAQESAKRTVIIDTRGSGYAKKGHMPSAIHLPYSQIATPTNALVIQPKSTLKKLFEERGIDYLDPDLKIILSCGSGVSVCHGYLALKSLGRDITEENTRIYDGSWKEWGKEDGLPKILPNEMD
mmetsp:Transcript_7626/g.17265  ORF Transcript_7626/g.17265 Transcript_7626/m.17265 type:complete len:446 (-) Transcript_7626:167-1504(-)